MNRPRPRLVLASVFAVAVAFAAARAQPPNVVYVLLDDAGYGDLGCYGQRKLATPNIDRLAREGMRFTEHYAGSTVCAPTRSCLMTGQHTGHTPVRGNGRAPGEPENVFPLGDGVVTVASLLRDGGYRTGCFGKWGLGGPGSGSDALALGFERFCGFYNQGFAHDHYPRWLWRDGEKLELGRAEYAQQVIVDAAFAFIREHADGPFFCYLPVTIPHAAMQAPVEYHERFRKIYPQFDDVIGRYGGDGRTTEVKNPIAGFAAMMAKLDDDIGALLDLLEELGIADDTVVMLSSDNGPHHEGGHDPEFWDSNGPLRGGKRSLYDGGIRVPFLARWPGRIAAGSTSDLVSAHWDLLPTLCELGGVAPRADTDGISLVPTLTGEGEQRRHEYLYWEFYEQGGRRALRMGRWKAVQNGLADEPEAPIELYDVTADPGEAHDVAGGNPEVVERAARFFREAHAPDPRWRHRPANRRD